MLPGCVVCAIKCFVVSSSESRRTVLPCKFLEQFVVTRHASLHTEEIMPRKKNKKNDTPNSPQVSTQANLHVVDLPKQAVRSSAKAVVTYDFQLERGSARAAEFIRQIRKVNKYSSVADTLTKDSTENGLMALSTQSVAGQKARLDPTANMRKVVPSSVVEETPAYQTAGFRNPMMGQTKYGTNQNERNAAKMNAICY